MKIALLGYGKMGHEIEKVALMRHHEIIVTIDDEGEWKKKNKELTHADMAIDFSLPNNAVKNIFRCFDINLPIVVGTTAWYDKLDEVISRCQKENQSLFYAPNFSVGMNIMFYLNKKLAAFAEKNDYQLILSEAHHIHKADKPSGTALKLAQDIIENNKCYQSWSLDDVEEDGILPVQAIRKGEINGIHEVNAISLADQITIRHEAFSRQGFAIGAVLAAEFLYNKKGIFTMDDMLNLQ